MQPSPPPPDPSRRALPQWLKITFYIGMIALLVWLERDPHNAGPPQNPQPAAAPPASDRDDSGTAPRPPRPREADTAAESNRKESAPKPPASPQNEKPDALLIHNVSVYDINHRVVYRGDVDLAPTLDRIERGERLRFSHDGVVFFNHERRLPLKPSGYYHEFVQPTPGTGGPGAQRVVIGDGGEVYYSSDHYRSFRRVR
ncbi:MAG TPA: ribonuclease domain-containing protein [Lacipirellulaceae bacterium]|nr:ribonuclease domain-containing protein [Lacipirellulaceae bacterium]